MISNMLVHLMHVLLLVLLWIGRHVVEDEMLELMPPPREGHHVGHTVRVTASRLCQSGRNDVMGGSC